MSSSFAQLKRSSGNNLDALTKELNKLQGNQQQQNNNEDDRFWQPEVDKAGNGYAVIRFLPAPQGEDVPFVRIWDHGFQGPGGWYIEKSLTTIGQKDPVSEYNTTLWNSGIEANKEVVRKQKRRLYFLSNIYVVSDPANPQNEGKVFLYRYGKKIFDKLQEAMNPAFQDETPVNPFDFWEGADFKLKIRKVEGYRNYDKSEFASPSALSQDDEELENVWKQQHGLGEFIAPDQFKSYDELKARLEKVLMLDDSPQTQRAKAAAEDTPPWDEPEETPAPVLKEAAAPTIQEDEDESLSFFEKLANDD
jgi:hypothetical protein